MARSANPVDEICIPVLVNDEPAGCWSCSPVRLDDLAVGWLLATGRARSVDEIENIDVTGAHARLNVRDAHPPYPCDLLMRPVPAVDARAPVPDSPVLPDLFRQLYASAEIGQASGGLHVAGVADGAQLVFSVEDVARHAAVDKIVGALARQQAGAHHLGLVLSARISGEIAWKAARAGFAWVASRSVPTTLAVAVAARAGLPLIARAASDAARVFGAADGSE